MNKIYSIEFLCLKCGFNTELKVLIDENHYNEYIKSIFKQIDEDREKICGFCGCDSLRNLEHCDIISIRSSNGYKKRNISFNNITCKNCKNCLQHPDFCKVLYIDVEDDFCCKYFEECE